MTWTAIALLILLLPGLLLAQKNGWDAKVQRIKCVEDPIIFEGLLAVDLAGGELRPTRPRDAYELATLLGDTFRQETALRCDPYHRALVAVQFTPYTFSMTDFRVPLYRVKILSHGASPTKTALEPQPPLFVTSPKYPTDEHCSIAEILDSFGNNNKLEDQYSYFYQEDCPKIACYCPKALLPPKIPTSGVTGPQLAASLETNIDECRREAEEEHLIPRIQNVDMVYELRERDCAEEEEFGFFEATIVSFLSVDPCKLGRKTLNRFLRQLIADYNVAQFEACDFAFRRIDSFAFDLDEASCATRYDGEQDPQRHHRNLFGLPGLPPFNFSIGVGAGSAENTTTSQNRGRRELRQDEEDRVLQALAASHRRHLQASNSTSALSYSSAVVESRPDFASYMKKDPPVLCVCSAFADDETAGITNRMFTQLADQAMQRVTNDQVRVLEQFEVQDTGCDPERKRFEFASHLIVKINVDSITKEEMKELEEDCVLAYNNIVFQQCSEDYFIVKECRVTYYDNPYGSHKQNLLKFHLTGTTHAHPQKEVSPFYKPNGYRRAMMEQLDGVPRSTEGHAPLRGLTGAYKDDGYHYDVEDKCPCQLGVEPGGKKPTLEQYVDAVNLGGLGLVVSAVEYY